MEERRLIIACCAQACQGYVDIADVVAILIASRGGYDPFADINGDGKVDSTGANNDVALARLLIGTKLP